MLRLQAIQALQIRSLKQQPKSLTPHHCVPPLHCSWVALHTRLGGQRMLTNGTLLPSTMWLSQQLAAAQGLQAQGHHFWRHLHVWA